MRRFVVPKPEEILTAMLAALLAGWGIMAALTPIINNLPIAQYNILVEVAFTKEQENSLFAIITGSSVLLFCLFTFLQSYISPIKRIATTILRILSFSFLLLLLGSPAAGILDLQFNPIVLLLTVALVLVCEVFFMRKPLPARVLFLLTIVVLVRYLVPHLVLFEAVDGGSPLLFDYGPAVLIAAAAYLVFLNLPQNIRKYLSGKPGTILLVVIGAASIVLSIAPMISLCDDYDNIYFTFLPAYHVTRGGVPFATSMSQYGLLYLLPWVALKLLLPQVPLSAETGFIVTPLLVMGFYLAYSCIAFRRIKHPLVAVGVVFAALYYTFLYRLHAPVQPAPPYPLSCSPSFTPLRFGIFLLPLVFLWQFVDKKQQKFLYLASVCSILALFFSFEVGIGLCVAGVLAAILMVVGEKKCWQAGIKLVLFDGAVLFGLAGLYLLYSLFVGQHLPSIEMYTLFTRIFRSGFGMYLLTNQMAFLVPIVISIFALVMGTIKLLGKDKKGSIYIFLAIVQLALLPYHIGRSLQLTLFGLCLPMLLLVGMIIDDLLSDESFPLKPLAQFLAVAYGCLLVMGTLRVGMIISKEWQSPMKQLNKQITYIAQMSQSWRVKSTQEYLFLKQYLPNNCPLVSFSGLEHELLMALDARPAFVYPFIRNFVVTQEQVDDMLPRVRGSYCVFMNRAHFERKDYQVLGVYEYLWSQIEPHATLLIAHPTLPYQLYQVKN